jgi:hypothetical protein
MVVEALTAAAVLYGLVVKPAQKFLLVNRALTPREATRTMRLSDGQAVLISSSVVEDDRGNEVIQTEVWDTAAGKRLLTAAEVELILEGRALQKFLKMHVPFDNDDAKRMIILINALELEIKTSRSRAVR